jgi:hypothetical protein
MGEAWRCRCAKTSFVQQEWLRTCSADGSSALAGEEQVLQVAAGFWIANARDAHCAWLRSGPEARVSIGCRLSGAPRVGCGWQPGQDLRAGRRARAACIARQQWDSPGQRDTPESIRVENATKTSCPAEKRSDINPTYAGHAIGNWEGKTLVVETIGFAAVVPGGPYESYDVMHLSDMPFQKQPCKEMTPEFQQKYPRTLPGRAEVGSNWG